MQFDILTLFPAMFTGPLTESIIKRAVQSGLISIGIHDIRAYLSAPNASGLTLSSGLQDRIDTYLAAYGV